MMKSKIITLQSGDYVAKINLSRGANCICLRNEKHTASILREPENPDIPDNPYLYGMPILFPVNRISGGKFTFEGRSYVFPVNEPNTGCHLHGTLHEAEFTALEQLPDKLVCRFRAQEVPYLQFPHAFEIRMEYILNDKGLTHKVSVQNLSNTNMPVMLGFHTTFNACFTSKSKPENIRVHIQIAEEYARNMQTYLPTGSKPDFDSVSTALADGSFNPFSQAISRHYRCAAPGKMVISDMESGLRVVYENDAKYKFRLIYNGNADGYICLEPQTCLANCPNAPVSREEAGFDVIPPGETKQYISDIYLTGGNH